MDVDVTTVSDVRRDELFDRFGTNGMIVMSQHGTPSWLQTSVPTCALGLGGMAVVSSPEIQQKLFIVPQIPLSFETTALTREFYHRYLKAILSDYEKFWAEQSRRSEEVLREYVQCRLETLEGFWKEAVDLMKIRTLENDVPLHLELWISFLQEKLGAWKLVETVLHCFRLKRFKTGEMKLSRWNTFHVRDSLEKCFFSKWVTFCLRLDAVSTIAALKNPSVTFQIWKYFLANDVRTAVDLAISSGHLRLATILAQGMELSSSMQKEIQEQIELWTSNGTFDLMDEHLAKLYRSLDGPTSDERNSWWLVDFAARLWKAKELDTVQRCWMSVSQKKLESVLGTMIDLYFVVEAANPVHAVMQSLITSEVMDLNDLSFSWELSNIMPYLYVHKAKLDVRKEPQLLSIVRKIHDGFCIQLEACTLWTEAIKASFLSSSWFSESWSHSKAMSIASRHFPGPNLAELEHFKESLDATSTLDVSYFVGSVVSNSGEGNKSYNLDLELQSDDEIENMLMSCGLSRSSIAQCRIWKYSDSHVPPLIFAREWVWPKSSRVGTFQGISGRNQYIGCVLLRGFGCVQFWRR
eukprot:TRINITY_DN5626_c0_g1_i4.p1 TRINITY_DN5626_c0_g1~~TRINITY_DN5626_c0_g1_i4.p1  ORF type:complete len:657 (+),score=156.96 TRINITY_DN5626_c0_g1_i4:234-1973(+)